MILGIGCDIVAVKRVANILDKTPAFLTHSFSKLEIDEFHRRKDDVSYLASRFACKEAIVKAYKEYNKPLNTIEILTEESGCPYVRIEGVTMKNILISLSYENDYVIAYAVLLSI